MKKYPIKQIEASLKRISKIKPNKKISPVSEMSAREMILYMAPKLMKQIEHGMSIKDIQKELVNDKFEISVPTLSRYLNQYQARHKESQANILSEAEVPASPNM